MERVEWHQTIATWCSRQIEASPKRPVFIGINGPQGAGKSTLADVIVSALGELGSSGVAISVDDFYLTHAEQCALAERFSGNRCLAHRGYPGTHDVALGRATLDSLAARRTTRVPVYDKSAHQGRGDRAPENLFRTIAPPIDFVLLEGWMLGFRPVDPATLALDLRAPNDRLDAYAAWDERLDAFITLEANSLDDIVRWRIDAERTRRERGEGALSEEQARDYIERFLPAYEAWLPGLRAHPPTNAVLEVKLASDRSAVSVHERTF